MSPTKARDSEKLAELGSVHSLLEPLQRQREQVLELQAPELGAAFLKLHEPPETFAFLQLFLERGKRVGSRERSTPLHCVHLCPHPQPSASRVLPGEPVSLQGTRHSTGHTKGSIKAGAV